MNFYEIALEKLGWVEVTLWFRMIDGYHFNHLENGHSALAEPVPRSLAQKRAWAGGRWSKKLWFAEPGQMLRVLTS